MKGLNVVVFLMGFFFFNDKKYFTRYTLTEPL